MVANEGYKVIIYLRLSARLLSDDERWNCLFYRVLKKTRELVLSNAVSPYLVARFRWNLPSVFVMWVGTTGKVFKITNDRRQGRSLGLHLWEISESFGTRSLMKQIVITLLGRIETRFSKFGVKVNVIGNPITASKFEVFQHSRFT